MTDPDALPGDDADYEDLDELEAIGLGILQELSLIRRELQAQRAAGGADHSPSAAEYQCECGDEFTKRARARRHAVQEHDAPRSEDHWLRLFKEAQP